MRLDLGDGQSIKETGTQLYIPRTGRLLVITITTRAGHSADDVKKLVNGIELLDSPTRHPADAGLPPGTADRVVPARA